MSGFRGPKLMEINVATAVFQVGVNNNLWTSKIFQIIG